MAEGVGDFTVSECQQRKRAQCLVGDNLEVEEVPRGNQVEKRSGQLQWHILSCISSKVLDLLEENHR